MKENIENNLPESEEPLEAENNLIKEQLIRARAELENQRKRLEREMDHARKYAIQDFVSNLLPAKDSMEKGVDVAYMENGISAEALMEGTSSTLKICKEAFKQAGIEEIDPLGEDFNPEFHEAMAMKKVEGEKPNIVLSVFQKGYLLNGRLIRPARSMLKETGPLPYM
jgi:molecular chaperone GrpE